MLITRLAPSPTGLLHLGNAWSFLLCWLFARANNGLIWLRIDDIDPQRSKPEYIERLKEDLLWLGLNWDKFANQSEIRQSQRDDYYTDALNELSGSGRVYPCFCTRRELRSLANAPHIGDEGVPYDGRCAVLRSDERERRIALGQKYCLRLCCPDEPVMFRDQIAGPQVFAKAAYGGDFPLRRSDGVWSYQLASTVDDAQSGVNMILRGRDLLPSTPRQIILAAALGYAIPEYAHIPLLLDEKGDRLAKRHQSLSLAALRARGISAAELTGWLAWMAGFNPDAAPLAAYELIGRFSLAGVGRQDKIAIIPEAWKD